MLSTDERRRLRQIGHGLRRDDPRFAWRLAIGQLPGWRPRHRTRAYLATELAFVVLAIVGVGCGLPALLVLGTAFGLLAPAVAFGCWSPPARTQAESQSLP